MKKEVVKTKKSKKFRKVLKFILIFVGAKVVIDKLFFTITTIANKDTD